MRLSTILLFAFALLTPSPLNDDTMRTSIRRCQSIRMAPLPSSIPSSSSSSSSSPSSSTTPDHVSTASECRASCGSFTLFPSSSSSSSTTTTTAMNGVDGDDDRGESLTSIERKDEETKGGGISAGRVSTDVALRTGGGGGEGLRRRSSATAISAIKALHRVSRNTNSRYAEQIWCSVARLTQLYEESERSCFWCARRVGHLNGDAGEHRRMEQRRSRETVNHFMSMYVLFQ